MDETGGRAISCPIINQRIAVKDSNKTHRLVMTSAFVVGACLFILVATMECYNSRKSQTVFKITESHFGVVKKLDTQFFDEYTIERDDGCVFKLSRSEEFLIGDTIDLKYIVKKKVVHLNNDTTVISKWLSAYWRH